MTSIETRHPAGLSVMIAATGVVSGDIAASPLYAFREGFIGAHALPLDRFQVLGVLSLLVWTLLIVVTLKYVAITMRVAIRALRRRWRITRPSHG